MFNDAPKKLAVLVSGGGTNMQAVLDAIGRGEINAAVTAVISSRQDAYALKRAEKSGIPTYACALTSYATREARDEAILKILEKCDADYVILAGYLGIITPVILSEFPYRIINIHPALLPLHGGKGCHGINVHREVIAAGEPFSGATVHFVDEGTDTGLIIAQEKLEVRKDDTPESLQERILENIEHPLLIRVMKDLCDGRITVENGKVNYVK